VSQTILSIEGTTGAVELLPDFQLGITANGQLTNEDAAKSLPPGETDKAWRIVQDSVYHTQAHWLDCFRNGREPETSGRDNLKTFGLVEAAYESAATGQAVKPVA
jgi:predicted dehydrogenase